MFEHVTTDEKVYEEKNQNTLTFKKEQMKIVLPANYLLTNCYCLFITMTLSMIISISDIYLLMHSKQKCVQSHYLIQSTLDIVDLSVSSKMSTISSVPLFQERIYFIKS